MRVLWEVGDVARALGVSPSSVINYARQGLLRAVARTPRGLRLFRPQDAAALQASGRSRQEAQPSRALAKAPARFLESPKPRKGDIDVATVDLTDPWQVWVLVRGFGGIDFGQLRGEAQDVPARFLTRPQTRGRRPRPGIAIDELVDMISKAQHRNPKKVEATLLDTLARAPRRPKGPGAPEPEWVSSEWPAYEVPGEPAKDPADSLTAADSGVSA